MLVPLLVPLPNQIRLGHLGVLFPLLNKLHPLLIPLHPLLFPLLYSCALILLLGSVLIPLLSLACVRNHEGMKKDSIEFGGAEHVG